VATSGTSYAGPAVAGAALLVKERMLNLGLNWIASPGRMNAVMLAMGDRGHLAGSPVPAGCVDPLDSERIVCGADRYLGLGRLKLRLHEVMFQSTKTYSSVALSPTYAMVNDRTPMAAGTRIAKCTLQQDSDLINGTFPSLNLDNIGRTGLTLRIRTPVSGRCLVDQGTVLLTRTDTTYDDKHMVAITDEDETLAGRCAEVGLQSLDLPSTGTMTVHLYCTTDNEYDY
jgi:hypothetical protein